MWGRVGQKGSLGPAASVLQWGLGYLQQIPELGHLPHKGTAPHPTQLHSLATSVPLHGTRVSPCRTAPHI